MEIHWLNMMNVKEPPFADSMPFSGYICVKVVISLPLVVLPVRQATKRREENARYTSKHVKHAYAGESNLASIYQRTVYIEIAFQLLAVQWFWEIS